MTNSRFIFISLFGLLFSCSGNEETTEEKNETTQTPTDSLAMATAFADFTTYVKSLEREVENVDSVLTKYENAKLNFTQEEKDSSFFVVKAFMQSFEIPTEEAEDYSEDGRDKMEKKYQKYGFDVWYEEGFPYLIPNLKFLENKFKKDISVELDDYLDVLKIVLRQTVSDAGLSVEWSELSEMIIACEDYVVENPDSKYFEEILSHYQGLMNLMLWGLDNTPILDYWTDETQKQLNKEVSSVYQKLMKDDKHKTGKIISDHIEFLESKNYEYTYEEIKFLTIAEVKMYLGVE